MAAVAVRVPSSMLRGSSWCAYAGRLPAQLCPSCQLEQRVQLRAAAATPDVELKDLAGGEGWGRGGVWARGWGPCGAREFKA